MPQVVPKVDDIAGIYPMRCAFFGAEGELNRAAPAPGGCWVLLQPPPTRFGRTLLDRRSRELRRLSV